MMEKLFGLILGLAGEIDPEFMERRLIDRGKDDRGMYLTAAQLFQMLQRKRSIRIGIGADAERQQHLIGMKLRVMVAEVDYLQLLDRFDDRRGHQLN